MITEIEISELEKKWAELLTGPKRTNEPKGSGDAKITAAELQARLKADKDYQHWLKDKEAVRVALEALYARDERPLVEELNQAGLNVASVWDLVNSKITYKASIPILIRHLSAPYHIKNKEGIVRSLAVTEAKGLACMAIIREYQKAPKEKSDYRWTFGNTMAVIITPGCVDDVIKIVSDKSNGVSRQMFVAALGNIQSAKADDVLKDLMNDKEVAAYARKALDKKKIKKTEKG